MTSGEGEGPVCAGEDGGNWPTFSNRQTKCVAVIIFIGHDYGVRNIRDGNRPIGSGSCLLPLQLCSLM